MSIIFMIWPILEARAEIQKYFRSFFGSNENFKICFPDLLTFRQGVHSFQICIELLTGSDNLDFMIFLVQIKTLKFAFEIYWPLTTERKVSVTLKCT